MKIKTDQLTDRQVLRSADDPSEIKEWSETDATHALSEIKKIRGYLEQIKKEIYTTIDAGFEDVSCFQTIGNASTVNCFNQRPSEFFEAAYTTQTFALDGTAIENRRQEFIDAGVLLNNYFEATPRSSIDDVDQLFLNDAGKMIGAINSSISQLNRVESLINRKDYQRASATAGAG